MPAPGPGSAEKIEMVAEGPHDLEHQDLGQHDARTEHCQRTDLLEHRNRQQADVDNHGNAERDDIQTPEQMCASGCPFDENRPVSHEMTLTPCPSVPQAGDQDTDQFMHRAIKSSHERKVRHQGENP